MPHRPISIFVHLSNRSYSDLFFLWILLNAVFAILYFLLATTHPEHAPQELLGLDPMQRLFDSIYFSVTTGTSTGYGDIVPWGFSKFLTMIHTCSALLLFAIFVAKLVASRQETMLQEMHHALVEKTEKDAH